MRPSKLWHNIISRWTHRHWYVVSAGIHMSCIVYNLDVVSVSCQVGKTCRSCNGLVNRGYFIYLGIIICHNFTCHVNVSHNYIKKKRIFIKFKCDSCNVLISFPYRLAFYCNTIVPAKKHDSLYFPSNIRVSHCSFVTEPDRPPSKLYFASSAASNAYSMYSR